MNGVVIRKKFAKPTMTIDDVDVVDVIGTEQNTGIVALTICDHLTWDDPNAHLSLLAAKINRYFGFIESGELVDAYPSALGKTVRIDVICKHAPVDTVRDFIRNANNVAAEYGATITLTHATTEPFGA